MDARYYTSAADEKKIVDMNHFVVSLLYDPNGDAENASLIVEGMNLFEKANIIKYDFFPNSTKTNTADIRIEQKASAYLVDAKSLFMQIFLKGKEYYCYSWDISNLQAANLHQAILKEQSNPPLYAKTRPEGVYNILADNVPLNSYIWALKHLDKLGCSISKIIAADFKKDFKHIDGFKPIAYSPLCRIL